MYVETTLNFALKIPYLAIFRLELEKTISTFSFSNCNISCKKTLLDLEPNLFYISIFGLEFEKTTVL